MASTSNSSNGKLYYSIIEFGTSYHMTSNSDLLLYYESFSGPKTVTKQVIGKRMVKLIENLTRYRMLHVQCLHFNFISVSKIV